MSAKAYEIAPLIPKFVLAADKSQSKIDCIECCGKQLFLGTNDSFVVKYVIEELPQSNGTRSFNCVKQGHKFLDIKKPIRLIKGASALDKLLVLCETSLIVLSMEDLEPIGSNARLKNVHTFCVNENPCIADPFSVQICVAPVGKGQIAVYNVTQEEKLAHVSTMNTIEPVSCLTADGGYVCAGLRSKYVILNYEHSEMQDLFPFSSGNFQPLVCRVAKEEFLLSGPDGLGMFVTAEGTSNRPPLQWSYPLISLTFHHPYILGLSNEIVMIHSILDQQQKQAVPFIGGQGIGNYEGKIYAFSVSSVQALTPVPWEKQVEILLLAERVEEALSLLEKVSGAAGSGASQPDQVEEKKRRFRQQAAFIYFSRAEMEQALDLFLESGVDERELIAIFPGIMPVSSGFVRAVPPLNNIADIIQLFHGDEDKILLAKKFLIHFLQMIHDSGQSQHQVEVDTALLKLYSELKQHDELETLLESEVLHCDFRECSAWLEKHSLHHAHASLLLKEGKVDRAIAIWGRILTGEVKDLRFKGLSSFVEVLSRVSQAELLWQYADLVLDHDELVGVKLFMHHIQQPSAKSVDYGSAPAHAPTQPSAVSSLDPNTVVDYLQRYPSALIMYLKYLIHAKEIKEEKFHTQLAIQFLDRIGKLKSQLPEQQQVYDEIVSEFRQFLVDSDYYRAQFLLPKVRDAGMVKEVAVLYGKIGEHEKALSIFVNQLRDFEGAEEYCMQNWKPESANSYNNLLHSLLATYLDIKLSETERDDFLLPALNVLNKHAAVLDPVKVIEMIPSNWSINVLGTFLHGAMRASVHKFRMTKMESALAKGDSVQRGYTLYNLQRHSMKLVESNYCCVCKKPFTDMKFAWYPNDVITHVECARLDNVCPLTGHCFTTMNAIRPPR